MISSSICHHVFAVAVLAFASAAGASVAASAAAEDTTQENDGSEQPRARGLDHTDADGDGDEPPLGYQLRFSQKIGFDDPITAAEVRAVYFPLQPSHYPLSTDLYLALRDSSNSSSMVLQDDFEVIPYDIPQLVEEVMEAIGEPPHAPETAFWPLFKEVMFYQKRRRSAGDVVAMLPTGMPWLSLPLLWKNLTIDQLAMKVHDEVRYTCHAAV
jgi:hypothetical protein